MLKNIEIKKVKIADMRPGSILHQTLPDSFIERVKKFKAIITEVEPSTIDETLKNFQRDATPEIELKLWEHIASIYQWAIVANSGLSLGQKEDVFRIILSLSADTKDFSKIKSLSRETIDEIVDRYQYA